MSFWEANKEWLKWAIGLIITLSSGGAGTLIVKGLTADAKQEVRNEMQIKIDEKDNYIKTLEDEIDNLQLDAVTYGFKYDMCCAGNPCQ